MTEQKTIEGGQKLDDNKSSDDGKKGPELDPGKIPQDVIEQTAAFKGVAGDKTRYKQERDDLRMNIGALQGQVAALQQQLANGKNGEPTDADPDFDPDDVATVGQLRKLKNDLVKELKDTKEELSSIKQTATDEKTNATVGKAKEKYSVKNVGEDLAFKAVINVGIRSVIEKYGEAFVRKITDAEALYNLCLMTDEGLIEKQKAAIAAGVISEMKQSGKGHKTGAGGGSDKGSTTDVVVQGKSISEINSMIDDLELTEK